MNAAEHAIENAVSAIERAINKATEQGMKKHAAYDAISEEYTKWKNTDMNLEQLSATPYEVWDMAMWVVYNDRPSREGEQE